MTCQRFSLSCYNKNSHKNEYSLETCVNKPFSQNHVKRASKSWFKCKEYKQTSRIPERKNCSSCALSVCLSHLLRKIFCNCFGQITKFQVAQLKSHFLIKPSLGYPQKVMNMILSQKKSPCYPAGNYMFKVNNRNTRTRCEICSRLTIKTHLVSLLLTLNIFHTLFLLLTLWKNIVFEDELLKVFLMNFFCICCKTKALTMCISKSTFFSFKPDRKKKLSNSIYFSVFVLR